MCRSRIAAGFALLSPRVQRGCGFAPTIRHIEKQQLFLSMHPTLVYLLAGAFRNLGGCRFREAESEGAVWSNC